jgi:hypothetical protein
MPDPFNEEVTKRAPRNARLETLQKKAEELRQRIADVEAQENAKRRKEDTRLKVIVGAALLANAAIHPETRAGIAEVLNRAVTAQRDREFLKGKGWL